MNNGLPETDFDVYEREPPACPQVTHVSARGQRQQPSSRARKRQSHRSGVNALSLILLIFLVFKLLF